MTFVQGLLGFLEFLVDGIRYLFDRSLFGGVCEKECLEPWQGVSAHGCGSGFVEYDSSRVVGDRPPVVETLLNGVPLNGSVIKTLTFNLVYNDAAMEQRVAQIYTPGSAFYHQYLGPEQIVQQFAESDTQLNTVKTWLTGHGYTILVLDPLRSSISVQAPG